MMWFWIITLQWNAPGRGTTVSTADGKLAPDQAAALRTRGAAFRAVIDAARRGEGIPDSASASVLFFSLEPDSLVGEGGQS